MSLEKEPPAQEPGQEPSPGGEQAGKAGSWGATCGAWARPGGRTGVGTCQRTLGERSRPWPLPRKARMATGPWGARTPSVLQSARLSSRCQDTDELGAARARVPGPRPLPGAGLVAAGTASPPPLPRPPSLCWTTSASPQPCSFLQSSRESTSSVKPTLVNNPLPEVLQTHAAPTRNSPVLPTRALHPHARQELPVKIKGGPPRPSGLGCAVTPRPPPSAGTCLPAGPLLLAGKAQHSGSSWCAPRA